jgi:hypothetical protein
MSECSSQGFGYAATEYGMECYCGHSIENTLDGAGVKVDEKECNMSCDGDFSLRFPPVVAKTAVTCRKLVGRVWRKLACERVLVLRLGNLTVQETTPYQDKEGDLRKQGVVAEEAYDPFPILVL